MKRINESYEVVVCGGGLAGLSAAVSAAREGARTCLIQDRPVLGGNSSSEIRVTPHGSAACHAYARETGIISEVLIEERAKNHLVTMETGGMNSVWDMVLYDLVMRTPNLTLHLNTSIVDVQMKDAEPDRDPVDREPNLQFGFYHRAACNRSRRLEAVQCIVSQAEVALTIHGQIFIDASGDSIVADLAGCEWRMGAESRDEFDEPHGLAEASTGVMGSSIHFRTKDMGRPCPYVAPEWAVKHSDPAYFECYKRSLSDPRGGYWWFEISVPWHTIHDNETIRHELTRHVLGVWDWMKNHDPKLKEALKNRALDWVGQVPGKRESRRIIGRHLLTENDALQNRVFEDEVAFGGWYVDLHEPGGLLLGAEDAKNGSNRPHRFCGPYGLPLRSLIAKDLDNLLLAGRNLSATHVALGTVRVMGTTALIGQAAGVAAAVTVSSGCALGEVPEHRIGEVQQRLLRAGCFLPNTKNVDSHDLALRARVRASSEASFTSVDPCVPDDPKVRQWWTKRDRLTQLRSQWIAVSTQRLESISIYLTNDSGKEQTIQLRLVDVDHIWDYQLDDTGLSLIAEESLAVPEGFSGWMEWTCAAAVTPGRYVRLDAMPNEALVWPTAMTTVPGFPSAVESPAGQMKRRGDACTNALRVDPPQKCWPEESVLNGVTRPYAYPNEWRSDERAALPQWLELRWDEAVSLSICEITFPGNLLSEHHKYPPFWRDPQTPADYKVQVSNGNAGWKTVAAVKGNYQRQRTHLLDQPVIAARLRILVSATNGDPSAAIVEVRCYG